MKNENAKKDDHFKRERQIIDDQSEQDLQFDTKKKLALEAMQEAVQTIKEIVSTSDNESLYQASKHLEEAIEQLNSMQNLAEIHSTKVNSKK